MSHDSSSVVSPTLLIFILISLFERCEAQGDDVVFAIPVIVVAVVIIFLCCGFWITFIINCYRHQKKKNVRFQQSAVTQHIFNIQRQPNYEQSLQVNDGSSQSYPFQNYSSALSTVIPPPLTTTNVFTVSAQTVPQASEPVSLPEATLHQREAPPDYEEAIRMKTVSHAIDLS